MDINKVKAKLEDLLPEAVDALRDILNQSTATPTTRLRAIETLFDRLGLPALRATMTKTVTTQIADSGELQAMKQELLEAKAETEGKINEIRSQLGEEKS